MIYNNITTGKFISRPNRFIAKVIIDRAETVVHVKNTGRCRELLVPGAEVFLEKSLDSRRKTAYDLVAVSKNGRLINMDSQAPNKAAAEFLQSGGVFPDIEFLRSETVFEDSRFDFYGIHGGREFFAEVKGVTLEEGGVVRFPDAPTQRGVKHINGLVRAVSQGFEGYIIFVVQMENVKYFEPNDTTHKEFGDALREASSCGVKLLCYDCKVTPQSIFLNKPVEIRL